MAAKRMVTIDIKPRTQMEVFQPQAICGNFTLYPDVYFWRSSNLRGQCINGKGPFANCGDPFANSNMSNCHPYDGLKQISFNGKDYYYNDRSTATNVKYKKIGVEFAGGTLDSIEYIKYNISEKFGAKLRAIGYSPVK